MWLCGILCQSVWGMIFQWGSTLKVSIELSATSRHCRNMTESMLNDVKPKSEQTNKSTAISKFRWNQVWFCIDIFSETWLSNSVTKSGFISLSFTIKSFLSFSVHDSNHWLNNFIWHWNILGGLSSTFINFRESKSESMWHGMALSMRSLRKSCFCRRLHPWNQWTTHWISFSVGENDIVSNSCVQTVWFTYKDIQLSVWKWNKKLSENETKLSAFTQAVPCKNVLSEPIWTMKALNQPAHSRLHCPLTESFNTVEYINIHG